MATGLSEAFHLADVQTARKKEREAAKKRRKEIREDREKQKIKQRREAAEMQRREDLYQMAIAKSLYDQSGVARELQAIEQRHKGAEIETVWDTKHRRYGQRVIWDRKLRGTPHGEHFMHPGGFFTPGWYWGKQIGEYRWKAVEATAAVAHGETVEIRGSRWRRVASTNEARVDSALGQAYLHPARFCRVEYVKK